jgi:hypothetical protein
MKTRDFCSRVAHELGCSQDFIFHVFTACIKVGKDIMAQGDEWRLPGLGKFFCTALPERRRDKDGIDRRDLDLHEADPLPKKKVECKFSPFKPTLVAVEEEDSE